MNNTFGIPSLKTEFFDRDNLLRIVLVLENVALFAVRSTMTQLRKICHVITVLVRFPMGRRFPIYGKSRRVDYRD